MARFLGLVAVLGSFISGVVQSQPHALRSIPFLIAPETEEKIWMSRDTSDSVTQKLEFPIRELIEQANNPGIASSGTPTWAKLDTAGNVFVYISPSPGSTVSDVASALRLQQQVIPQTFDSSISILTAWISITDLPSVAALGSVGSISLVTDPYCFGGGSGSGGSGGAISGEPDRILLSQTASNTWCTLAGANTTGRGVKVGVISDDCGTLAARTAAISGHWLPSLSHLNLLDNPRGTRHEGLDLLELVHVVAPDADLDFCGAGTDMVATARNIIRLADDGCSVICDDIFWPDEPFFEDGPISQAIQRVSETMNVVYVTAAGNTNNNVYTSMYNPVVENVPNGHHPATYTVHEDPTGTYCIGIDVPAGETLRADLQWAEPRNSPQHHFGLLLYDPSSSRILRKVYTARHAWQELEWGPADSRQHLGIIIEQEGTLSTPVPLKLLLTAGEVASLAVPRCHSTVIGHSMVADALACGAVDSISGSNYCHIESFSGVGPVENVLDNPPTRAKPDLVAEDDVHTSQESVACFTGTSVAAPQVAGLAALLRAANPNLSVSDIRNTIISSATPLGDATQFGAGRADAFHAMASILGEVSVFTTTSSTSGTTITSSVTLPAHTGAARPMVCLQFDHPPTRPGYSNLTVTLTPPAGSTGNPIVLMSDASGYGVDVILDDNAAMPIPTQDGIIGCYQPANLMIPNIGNALQTGGTWQLTLQSTSSSPTSLPTLRKWGIVLR